MHATHSWHTCRARSQCHRAARCAQLRARPQSLKAVMPSPLMANDASASAAQHSLAEHRATRWLACGMLLMRVLMTRKPGASVLHPADSQGPPFKGRASRPGQSACSFNLPHPDPWVSGDPHEGPRLPTTCMAVHALTQRGAADDLDEALLALALARHEPHGAGVRQHVAAQRPLRVGHKHRAAAGVAHHLRGGHEEGRGGA